MSEKENSTGREVSYRSSSVFLKWMEKKGIRLPALVDKISSYLKKFFWKLYSWWAVPRELEKSNQLLKERYLELQSEMKQKEEAQRKESELRRRLEELNQTLEQRVLQRSQQLEESYCQLEAVRSKFFTLGEMSALIAHDLAVPMKFLQSHIDQLGKDQQLINNEQYIKQFDMGLSRSLDLVGSLRSYLKNPVERPEDCSFLEVHSYVLRLLEAQKSQFDFSRGKIKLDRQVEELSLKISRMNLIHILYNLYRHVLDSLLKKGRESFQFGVRILEDNLQQLSLEIWEGEGSFEDGLQFEEGCLASCQNLQMIKSSQGLGLCLVYRLLTRMGGGLSEGRNKSGGRVFRLTLKKAC